MVGYTSTAQVAQSAAPKAPAAAPAAQAAGTDLDSQLSSLESSDQADLQTIAKAQAAMQASAPTLTPPPQQAPSNPLRAFGSAASLFAILGSLVSRAPVTAALNASASAMNAIHQKNLEDYQIHYNNWKQSTDFALQQAQLQQQAYQNILDNAKLSHSEKMDAINAAATIHQDKVSAMHMRNSDAIAFQQLQIDRASAAMNLQVQKANVQRTQFDEFNQNPALFTLLTQTGGGFDNPASIVSQAQDAYTGVQKLSTAKSPVSIDGTSYSPEDYKAVTAQGADISKLTPKQQQLAAQVSAASAYATYQASQNSDWSSTVVNPATGMSNADVHALAISDWQSGNTRRTFPDTQQGKTAAMLYNKAQAQIEETQGAPGQLDPNTLNFYVQSYMASGKLPPLPKGPKGYAENNQVMQAVAKQAAAENITPGDIIYNGVKTKAVTVGLSRLTTTYSQLDAADQTAMSNIQYALSVRPPDLGNISPIMVQGQLKLNYLGGDRQTQQFVTALQTAVDEYSKVAQGSYGAAGTTDSARNLAMSMINPDMTEDQLQGAVEAMQNDMQNKKAGYAMAIGSLGGDLPDLSAGYVPDSSPNADAGPSQPVAPSPAPAQPSAPQTNPAW